MSDESIPPQDGTPTPTPVIIHPSDLKFRQFGQTPNVPTWSLDLNCNHCQARIHYDGLLGDKSPLKVDNKRRALNRQAEQWVQQANNTTIRDTPPADLNRMIGIQTRIPMADGSYRRVYRIVPLPDRFVVCPVCKGRVYVC